MLKEAKADGPLGNVLGRAGANELKKHFRTKNKKPNKLGGTRTNFWSRVAESVQSPRSIPGKVVIPVSHPAIAQKVFGGTITAKKSKNLAIPIDPIAHGKSPRVFPLLKFAMTRAGVKLLGQKDGGIMKWLFVLKPSIDQAPDPTALPTDADVGAAMEKAGNIYFRNRS